jgi:hypothetical protein
LSFRAAAEKLPSSTALMKVLSWSRETPSSIRVSFHLNHRWFASQYTVFSEVSLVVTIRTYAARLPAKSSSSFGGVQIYERPTKESS